MTDRELQTVKGTIAIMANLAGRPISDAGVAMIVQDLNGQSYAAVMKALSRCRKEVRGFPTTSDIISRIDDGRPGAEEAWALIPRDESQSVVWTDETREAFGACRLLIQEDPIAARMAFKQTYERLVAEARFQGEPVRWTPSLGFDRNQRSAVLKEAVAKNRLSIEYLPDDEPALPTPRRTLLSGPPEVINDFSSPSEILQSIKARLLNQKTDELE